MQHKYREGNKYLTENHKTFPSASFQFYRIFIISIHLAFEFNNCNSLSLLYAASNPDNATETSAGMMKQLYSPVSI